LFGPELDGVGEVVDTQRDDLRRDGREHLEAKQDAILQAFDLLTRERGLEPFAAYAYASAQVGLRSAGWAMVLLSPEKSTFIARCRNDNK
jgi:hypothetical protein